jgi:hypothetical protein
LVRSHKLAVRNRRGHLRRSHKIITSNRAEAGRFRDLCNDEPLNQGRHGGTASGPLRDASQSELDEARGIASAMIEGYLSYLEANP